MVTSGGKGDAAEKGRRKKAAEKETRIFDGNDGKFRHKKPGDPPSQLHFGYLDENGRLLDLI